MKKNGFTLIELLAVIVVLAIIALIAVPIVINIIEKARIGALKDSAYGIIEAADLHFAQNTLTGNAINMTFEVEEGKKGLYIKGTETKLNFKGDQLDSGSEVLITTAGKVGIKLISGDYCVVKTTAETEVKLFKSDCLNGLNGEVNESVLTKDLAEIKALFGSEVLTTTSATVTGAINEINEKVDSYGDEINTLSESLASTDSKVTTLNGAVSTLNGTVSTLGGKVTTINDEVDTLAIKVNSGITFSYDERFTGNYWINGKKIYTKTINFGTLPNTATKNLTHGISDIELIWFDMKNSYTLSPDGYYLPITIGNPSSAATWYAYASPTLIAIVTGQNRSTYTAIVTVLYTKTTD